MTSSQATAYYLHKHHEGQKLYVCGTESLKEELRMVVALTSCEKSLCLAGLYVMGQSSVA